MQGAHYAANARSSLRYAASKTKSQPAASHSDTCHNHSRRPANSRSEGVCGHQRRDPLHLTSPCVTHEYCVQCAAAQCPLLPGPRRDALTKSGSASSHRNRQQPGCRAIELKAFGDRLRGDRRCALPVRMNCRLSLGALERGVRIAKLCCSWAHLLWGRVIRSLPMSTFPHARVLQPPRTVQTRPYPSSWRGAVANA